MGMFILILTSAMPFLWELDFLKYLFYDVMLYMNVMCLNL